MFEGENICVSGEGVGS